MSIPLHCTICPKRPNFSDVSHLLTHIASKGHLSNYYKVKVRASQEDASRRLIEAYDRWYAQWDVEELMSERMSQKDKRRSRARPAARPTPAPAPKIGTPAPARRVAAGNLLDPRLSEQQQQHIKIEPFDTPTHGPVLRHRPFVPHIQYWASGSRASSRSYTNPDYETSSEYSEPSERRRYRYNAVDSCAIEDDPAEPVADPMAVSESTRLKGVYWPGMDIFDSATSEMRRKRNQKKDSSVVEQLELNSQQVEATELIFSPQGTFKRQRRISNAEYDDEDVEIKTESPQPTRPRPALARMDVNTRRSRQPTRPMYAAPSRSHYEERGRSIFDYDGNGRAPKRKRGAFTVYQDDDDDEVTFSQPATMAYLTSGFKYQPSPSPAPSFPSYKPINEGFQYENKENIPPMFPQTAAYGNYHNHQGSGFHHHAFAYGIGQEQRGFQYHEPVYAGNHMYQQQQHQVDDDQRTLTAPPSPSTI